MSQALTSGRFRGRRLPPLPEGVTGLRPTGAKARAALLNRLQFELPGARVLELCAGSGAVSIDAVGRGAAHSTLVERDPRMVAWLRRMVTALQATSQLDVVPATAQAFLRDAAAAGRTFELVFVDPPWELQLEGELLQAVDAAQVVSAQGVLVLELPSARVASLPVVEGLQQEAVKTYAASALVYYRRR